MKIDQNSEFRVDNFVLDSVSNFKFPHKIEIGTFKLNVSLIRGEFYFSVIKSKPTDEFLVQTPMSNLELESGKYYVSIDEKSVLVYIIDGSLGVYDNITNKKETVGHHNVVLLRQTLLSPKQKELFGDKMSTLVKYLTPDKIKHLLDSIKNIVSVKDYVIFI